MLEKVERSEGTEWRHEEVTRKALVVGVFEEHDFKDKVPD